MSSTTPNLGLVKLSGTDNFSNANALAGNWDKIDTALASKQYNLGALTNSTIADQALAFANAHKGENGFVGAFYLSASTSSDLPAATNEWKYAYGYFRVRMSPQNGSADGEIVLYGFNTGNIAVRQFANGTVAASWSKLATGNITEYSGTKNDTYLSAIEGRVTKYGRTVSGYLVITAGASFSAADLTLVSGLPSANNSYVQLPCICLSGTDIYKASRVRITTSGNITTWYGFGFNSGASYLIPVNYICA